MCHEALTSILLNGTISSYDTLEELYLGQMPLTDDIIDQIRKFKNLKLLSLSFLEDTSSNAARAAQQRTKPIPSQQLETLSVDIGQHKFGEIQKILIGFHPKTLSIESTGTVDPSDIDAISIPEIPVIDHLNIKFDLAMSLTIALGQWLDSAQIEGRQLFNQTDIFISLPNYISDEEVRSVLSTMTASLIPIFRFSRKSKLKLQCFAHELSECNIGEVVEGILNAPFGTFTEIRIFINCTPLDCGRKNGEFCLERMANSLGDEETDHYVVGRVFMEYVEDAEEWMEPWLVFDEARMKQIGLRKLNVNIRCDMGYGNLKEWIDEYSDELDAKVVRCQNVLDEMSEQWVKDRIEHWQQSARKCINLTKGENIHSYCYTIKIRLVCLRNEDEITI